MAPTHQGDNHLDRHHDGGGLQGDGLISAAYRPARGHALRRVEAVIYLTPTGGSSIKLSRARSRGEARERPVGRLPCWAIFFAEAAGSGRERKPRMWQKPFRPP